MARYSEDIEKFYEHLKENQIPKNVNQEAQGYGSQRYTADMWTLEVCECLLGMDCKLAHYKQKQLLFDSLSKVKDDANQICVGEVGRGLDIVIAKTIKPWKIICYDHNPIYKQYLDKYFYEDSIEYHAISTHGFIQNLNIKEDTIFIIDNTKCRDFKALEKNENIVHLIFYGKLLW